MKHNELKRLSRKELLEILLLQSKKIEELKIELKESDKKIKSKNITLATSGSLAEASLKLSHIFEDADEAISIYKININKQIEEEKNNFRREGEEIRDKLIVKTKELCNRKIEQTIKNCIKKEQETEAKCKKIENEYLEKLRKLEKYQ